MVLPVRKECLLVIRTSEVAIKGVVDEERSWKDCQSTEIFQGVDEVLFVLKQREGMDGISIAFEYAIDNFLIGFIICEEGRTVQGLPPGSFEQRNSTVFGLVCIILLCKGVDDLVESHQVIY